MSAALSPGKLHKGPQAGGKHIRRAQDAQKSQMEDLQTCVRVWAVVVVVVIVLHAKFPCEAKRVTRRSHGPVGCTVLGRTNID